jgi:hypothetical protein
MKVILSRVLFHIALRIRIEIVGWEGHHSLRHPLPTFGGPWARPLLPHPTPWVNRWLLPLLHHLTSNTTTPGTMLVLFDDPFQKTSLLLVLIPVL